MPEIHLQSYIAVLTIILLAGMVLTRSIVLRRQGIRAIKFGDIDKTDFLIPPFVLFYFYLISANAFSWPSPARSVLFESAIVAWVGVAFCLFGLTFFFLSLVSFGRSFRVGIDTDHPDKLVTTGVFAISRNPIYVAFGSVLLGQFLIFPNWILLVYLIAGFWLLHRQVLREEEFLKKHYGQQYSDYCKHVRRYL